MCFVFFFFFKQKTAYEMRISDWSSDVCSSDLAVEIVGMQLGVMIRHAAEQGDAADSVEVGRRLAGGEPVGHFDHGALGIAVEQQEIGRASCRERVCQYV